MAHFRFQQRSIRGSFAEHPAVAHRTLKALKLVDAEVDEPVGPGWFDSSSDLMRGLEVLEGAASDAPLNDWLALCLRTASGGAQRDEQPSAGLVPAAAHRALGDTVQLGDLGLAVAPEVTHLDEFSEFGIDGLELV